MASNLIDAATAVNPMARAIGGAHLQACEHERLIQSLKPRHCAAHSGQYSRFSVCSGDDPLYGGLEEATT
jgi:hypothetical protein